MSGTEFVSLITFTTRPGMEEAFLAAFGACGMLTRPQAIDGFISAELLRQYTDDGSFAVIARWSSPDAYSAWQSISTTEAPRESLKKLGQALEGMTPGAIRSEENTSELQSLMRISYDVFCLKKNKDIN